MESRVAVAAVVVASAAAGTSDVAEVESSTASSFVTRPFAVLPTLREDAKGCLDGSPCGDLLTAG